ncbi:hypothetical protein [Vreelandella populi]|uniref:Uncharacterized protein n=1 Tax=Vreelandella populi TaxID=2498858 RepID=A0A3S0WLD1_9GAMM|nr:hypothetical protein [Halomonas populi]RUR37904.1 hypothetical protein ELY25_10620 [Halomonas populi]RUR48882.1 hypothetical protein ELY37_03270 [Halomonas populi]RUR55226.1 hypothetical protein ELY40_06805 [Halomonas populi]
MPQRSIKAASPPWEIVALEKFSTPQNTQASQWRRSWRAAATSLVGKRAAEQQAKDEDELRLLPEVKLAHLVPPIDWSSAAALLSQTLFQHKLDNEPVVFFITPPHGGHAPIVSHWAEQQGINEIAPPTYQELTGGSLEWVERCVPLKRWAVPALERHLLRHSYGLQGVRALLERAFSGRLGQGVIGCDSWTYAYLQHVVGVEGAPVFTLQALGGEQLAHYFADIANNGKDDICVYSTRTGNPVLGHSEEDNTAHKASAHKELQRLAAHCRGHMGIAWHYWRARLRGAAAAKGDDASQDTSQELWLVDALADAELSADTGDVAMLVLHTLLLHGGLEDQVLGDVLPFSHHEALNARLALARQGILARKEDGRWQVAPLSYASVRQLLETRNYLVDPL